MRASVFGNFSLFGDFYFSTTTARRSSGRLSRRRATILTSVAWCRSNSSPGPTGTPRRRRAAVSLPSVVMEIRSVLFLATALIVAPDA